jgi:hypothetical protein
VICVSLPVHTRPAVVASQLANFAAFLPEARVILHVSADARFTLDQLTGALSGAGCGNASINPQRLPTRWGEILPSHLSNIAWIRRHVPRCTRICLHSSNDMLVRHGLARHLGRGGNFLQRRPLRPGSRWRFAAPALADPALGLLRQRLGNAPALGSQVEGASYEAEVLYEVADLIGPALDTRPPRPYPREEVWLSTLAHARGATVGGMPYVFSEVHRFDRTFWKVLDVADPLIGRPGDPRYLPRRALEFLMIRSGFHRIDRTWVDRIAATDTAAPDRNPALWVRQEWLSDGTDTWRVCERRGLYGVKRVPRRTDAPLRRYIDRLGACAPPSIPANAPGADGRPATSPRSSRHGQP